MSEFNYDIITYATSCNIRWPGKETCLPYSCMNGEKEFPLVVMAQSFYTVAYIVAISLK